MPEPAPNKGVQPTARSLRLRSGFRQRLTPGVGPTAWPAQQELTDGICKGVFQLSTL